MLASGTILQNRYVIERLIAEGGMGAVYLARDQRLDSVVALKETLFADERMSKAFEREARLLARLRHPALPRVSDHFIEESGQFLVMEYIPGEDLAETLKRRAEPFSADEVIRWADQLLDALEYLHSQDPPVVHRDIKPQNLKVTERGQIILLDFGLAKGTPLQVTQDSSIGSIHGFTPHYAPMEQVQGTGTDPRSDLYALGATLYHLVTGVTPQDALTRAAAIVEGQPDPLLAATDLDGQVSAGFAALLHRALAISRINRHACAAEMRSSLRVCEIESGSVEQETEVIGLPGTQVPSSYEERERPPKLVADEEEGKDSVHDSTDKETVLREEVTPQADVSELVAVGASAFDAGQYVLAVEHWEAALRLSPDEPGVKESINNARRAIRKEEGRKAQVERLLAEGTEAFDDRRYEQAVEKLSQALAIHPNEPGVEASLKSARMAMEKEGQRQGKVKQLVSLGSSAFNRGEYELAVARWNEALSLSPHEPGIKGLIENASQRQELFEKAQRDRPQQPAQQSDEKAQVFAEEPSVTYHSRRDVRHLIWRIAVGSVLLVGILMYVLFFLPPRTAPTESNDASQKSQVPAVADRQSDVPIVADRQSQVPAANVLKAIRSGSPLVLYVEAATGDSWLKYQIDDKKPTTLVLRQGESQGLPPAKTQIVLDYGNRLTLKLTINGHEVHFPPDIPKFKGQVVISRDNLDTFLQ